MNRRPRRPSFQLPKKAIAKKQDCISDLGGQVKPLWSELTEERKTGSDIHEHFFVKELLGKDIATKQPKDKIILPVQTSSSDTAELFVESDAPSDEEGRVLNPPDEADEEEEVLTMGLVRFASLPILPSQIDLCSLEYQERQRKR